MRDRGVESQQKKSFLPSFLPSSSVYSLTPRTRPSGREPEGISLVEDWSLVQDSGVLANQPGHNDIIRAPEMEGWLESGFLS